MASSEFNATTFYKKLREDKQLTGVRCKNCGHLSPEPRPMCPECHGWDMEWHQFSGKATLSTFTTISVVPDYWGKKGYGRDKPFCSGIVTLEEGPRISARITGVDGSQPQNIHTGGAMVLDADDIDPEHPTVSFKPA